MPKKLNFAEAVENKENKINTDKENLKKYLPMLKMEESKVKLGPPTEMEEKMIKKKIIYKTFSIKRKK